MAEKYKSYNIEALKGADVDDLDVRDELKEYLNIDIPVELCYTPEFPKRIIKEMYKSNVKSLPTKINDATGVEYTPDEAVEESRKLAKEAEGVVDTLLKVKK